MSEDIGFSRKSCRDNLEWCGLGVSNEPHGTKKSMISFWSKIVAAFVALSVLSACRQQKTIEIKDVPLGTPALVNVIPTPGTANDRSPQTFAIKKDAFPFGIRAVDEEIYRKHMEAPITKLLDASDTNYVLVFDAVFKSDPVLKGNEEQLAHLGMYNVLHVRIMNNARRNRLQPWEKEAGNRLYLLFLKVKALPHTAEFSKARIGIIQGALGYDLSITHGDPERALAESLAELEQFK